MRNACFNEYKKPRGNRSRKHTDAKQFVRIWNHFACFHLPNSVLRRLAKYSHCDNVFDWQQRDNLWMISISSKYQSEAGQASQSHGIGTKKRDAAKDFLSKPEVRSLEARHLHAEIERETRPIERFQKSPAIPKANSRQSQLWQETKAYSLLLQAARSTRPWNLRKPFFLERAAE